MEKLRSGKKEAKALSNDEVKYLFDKLEKSKYKFMAAIMLYTGLRVEECVSLRINDFNFADKYLLVQSIKKRDNKEGKKEKMFINQTVLNYAANYWTTLSEKQKSQNCYMFPCLNNRDSGNHITRKQVWRVFNNAAGITPHSLRHTYITNLAMNNTDPVTLMTLARHSRFETTQIYITISDDKRREAVLALERRDYLRDMFDRVFSTRSRAETAILPYSFSGEVKHVGRIKEINNIINLSEKKVNTVILGQQGIGKSHILKKLKLEKHLWFDDLDSMKKSVADAILMLCHGVKEKVAELLNITEKNVVTKFSIPQLVNALISLTEKLEYTIIVDDATNMTPSALRIMAKLKSHFHMIVACRYIELKNMEAFTGFEKVEIIPFTQAETFAMIEKNCLDFKSRIKDYAAFRMHVWTETDGIPEFILDKLERYRKERVIRVEQFNTIGYNTNNEFSVTPIVFLMVGSLVVYKFYIREQSPIDKNGGMLIGAAAMVFLMFGRLIFGQFKQKYI